MTAPRGAEVPPEPPPRGVKVPPEPPGGVEVPPEPPGGVEVPPEPPGGVEVPPEPPSRGSEVAPERPPGAGRVDPLAEPPSPAGAWNLANALTVLRLLLVPVFLAMLFAGGTGWRLAAFAVFAVASVTDRLDGEVARRRGLVTDFGKIADPIADKALTGGALVGLSLLGELPWWVTVVIVTRELGVTLLRFWVIRHGVIAASRGGKLKTLLQVIAIGLYVLPEPYGPGRELVMGAALVVTMITGIDYTARAARLRRAGRARQAH